MNFGLGFLKHFGGNVELREIDEYGMKYDEMRVNWQDKWKEKRGNLRKGHGWPLRAVIRREILCVLQNNNCICCVGCECLCNELLSMKITREVLFSQGQLLAKCIYCRS